jgi:amino acid transporter
MLLKSSFALVGFGAYMLVLIDLDESYIKYIALVFLAFIFVLNITGAKKVGKVQLYIVTVSVLFLIGLSFFGLQNINPEFLTTFLTEGDKGLLYTIAFVYISYSGVTKVAAIAEEIKNPSKKPPAIYASFISADYRYIRCCVFCFSV